MTDEIFVVTAETIKDVKSHQLPEFAAALKERMALSRLRLIEEDADAERAKCATFAGFVKRAWHVIEPGTQLKWSWHLDAMCDHLEAISFGKMTPWLIINVPPGSSKSTIVSVLWQAWEWGPLNRSHLRYVSTSFEEGNVKRDTRKTRDLILSPWYQKLWGDRVTMMRAGEMSFANTATGFREGVTFAAITGKRGDRVVIDDPHSLKGAESESQRNEATRLFLEGGLNRTNDAQTSAMVIVMQRLHQDDLTGVLLRRDLGFMHLMIPMEYERSRACATFDKDDNLFWHDPRKNDGDLMDEQRFPIGAVNRQKLAGDYAYAGQYQQRPAPREGGMFKVENIGVVENCPAGGETVAGWDFAGSKRKNSPFTVRLKMTRVGGDYYIRHVERKRTNPTELYQMVERVVTDDGMSVFQSMPQDPGQAGKAQKWSLSEQLAGYRFEITPETGDKETRAEPFAAMVGAGRVFMVRGDWNGDFIEEARSFPAGSYKDQIDAASRAFSKLIRKTEVVVNAAPEIISIDDTSYMSVIDVDDPWSGL